MRENTTVDVVVVNVFLSGDLVIQKDVVGSGAEYFGQGPFTVHVRCTLTTGTVLPFVVYNDDVILGGDQPLEATISGIPTGAECAVTETDAGGADVSVVEPGSVTIGGPLQEPVRVVVTNTFLAGSVTVEKVITGGGAEAFGQGPFEVTLQCVDPADSSILPDIVGGAVRTLDESNDYSTTYEAIPAGMRCGIVETDTGGADSTRLLDADGNEIPQISLASTPSGTSAEGYFEITADTDAMFILENTFEPPLPATGFDARTMIGVAGTAGLLIAAGVVLMVIRRRQLV